MSIFRLFKSAVVLSIVLYFEGCGGGDKKNKTNQPSEDGGKTNGSQSNSSAQANSNDLVDQTKSEADVIKDRMIKDFEITDASEIAVLDQAVTEIKKLGIGVACSGDEFHLWPTGRSDAIIQKLMENPAVVKIVAKHKSMKNMGIESAPSTNQKLHVNMAKLISDSVDKAVDEFFATKQPVDSEALIKIHENVGDKVVEGILIPSTSAALRDQIKNEIGAAIENRTMNMDFVAKMMKKHESLVQKSFTV